MTSLHEELVRPAACKLCDFLDGLAPSEAYTWQLELALPTRIIGHASVAEALKRRDVDISESSVRRHRKAQHDE